MVIVGTMSDRITYDTYVFALEGMSSWDPLPPGPSDDVAGLREGVRWGVGGRRVHLWGKAWEAGKEGVDLAMFCHARQCLACACNPNSAHCRALR